MHLITALTAGVKGAENGTAEIYSRGTSTRATYYTDFERTSSVSSGANVTLDANGGATIYVLEYVTVIVKDSNGSTVRTFTDGVSASATEVISDSFTGVDYVSGASAVSKPITLAAVLDKWDDSAGADDWQVDVNGTATNLDTAIGSFAGMFFNIKDPAYGAVGDGTTDDTTSLIAAEAAAAANGGIIYFPPGTYRLTADTVISRNVNLMGAGSFVSFLNLDNAANADMLSLAGAASGRFQKISNLGFNSAQATSGSFITSNNANSPKVIIENCYFNGTSGMTGALVDADTQNFHTLIISDCAFVPIATGDSCIKCGDGHTVIKGCAFDIVSAYADRVIDITNGSVFGNIFEIDDMSAGASVGVYVNNQTAGDKVAVVGNYFTDDGGASSFSAIQFADLTGITGNSTAAVEFGNVFGNTFGEYQGGLAPGGLTSHDASNIINVSYGSRRGRVDHYAGVAANTTIYPIKAEVITVDITGGGNYTFNCDSIPPPGEKLYMVLYNSSNGAGGTMTFGTGFAPNGTLAIGADFANSVVEFLCVQTELSDDSIELRLLEVSRMVQLVVAP
jgi:hypothetical protein